MKEETTLFTAFSQIPLNVEGSNIDRTGWMPSEDDKKYIDENSWQKAVKEYEEANEKVMFNNVSLQWDSCDCGDGYGCSHGSYVYEILISNEDKTHKVDVDDSGLSFYNDQKQSCIPMYGSTIYDFYRACELVDIKLQLSDYAKSILLTPLAL